MVPIDKPSVVLAIILSVIFLHEPLDWKTIVGGILICAGSLEVAL